MTEIQDCGLDIRDCERDATKKVIITSDDDHHGYDRMEKYTCDPHIGWYRTTYEERGYDVEFVDVEKTDA